MCSTVCVNFLSVSFSSVDIYNYNRADDETHLTILRWWRMISKYIDIALEMVKISFCVHNTHKHFGFKVVKA